MLGTVKGNVEFVIVFVQSGTKLIYCEYNYSAKTDASAIHSTVHWNPLVSCLFFNETEKPDFVIFDTVRVIYSGLFVLLSEIAVATTAFTVGIEEKGVAKTITLLTVEPIPTLDVNEPLSTVTVFFNLFSKIAILENSLSYSFMQKQKNIK